MDCRKKCRVDGKYFISTCCGEEKRALLSKPWKHHRGIELLSPFNQLWFLPWELQTTAYMPNINTTNERSFELPSVSLSTLTAQTTPGSYVPLFWIANALTGPITSQGVELNTIFSGIDYRVTWTSTERVKIGFYTQMAFLGNDIYPLVDNDYVLQLSCGTEGSFVMGNYERFYVAADSKEAANITLVVQVVIPEGCSDDRTERLQVECCNYRVYKTKVENFVVVKSTLNPELKGVYRKIVQTFLDNALAAPVNTTSPDTIPSAGGLDQAAILTYYDATFPDIVGMITPVDTTTSRATCTVYTNTNNFAPPEYPRNQFPARSGPIDPFASSTDYLGVRMDDISFSVDIYYDITINNLIVPRLKRTTAICVVAMFFSGIAVPPTEVIVGGSVVGNDHTWMVDVQNPPPTTRITNSNPLNRRPLTIPASFTNVVLSVRPGVVTAAQPFEASRGSVSDNMFDGFVTFNSVIAVPTPTTS